MRRVVGTDHHVARLVFARAVFVEVVAEVEHGVEVPAGGEVAVGGEIAGLPVGAGHDTELQPVHGAPAAGAVRVRPTGDIVLSEGEPVPVARAGGEPACNDLDGVVAARAGGGGTPGHHFREAGSADTSQRTETSGPAPLPGSDSGVGVTRVHSSTLSGMGSPEATPWPKTPVWEAENAPAGVLVAMAPATAATPAERRT